jgi:hypothetical protein
LFLADLQATTPYDDPTVWERFNVYRLDIDSNESGAHTGLEPEEPNVTMETDPAPGARGPNGGWGHKPG